MAVDPEDLMSAASAAARAAVENICPVVEEADSDTDWRGGEGLLTRRRGGGGFEGCYYV